MATVLQCDGCKKISPDENKIHIANSWCEVKVSEPNKYGGRTQTYQFCEDCFPPSKTLRSVSWLVQLREFLGRGKESEVSDA